MLPSRRGGTAYRLLTLGIIVFLIALPVYAAQSRDLIKNLSNLDWKVRYQAALALGEQRNKSALPSLIKALSDRERIVRDSAALALTRIGGKEVEKEFLEALFSRNGEARSRAALALGRMKVKRAVKPLLKLLHDGNWFVRWSAALALGMIGEKQAVPGLESVLQDSYYDRASRKYPVREAATGALARIEEGSKENLARVGPDLIRNPGDVMKVLSLAEDYLGKKEERKAIRLLERLRKLNPPNKEYKVRVRFDLAYGYGQVGKWEKSRELFGQLVEQYPHFQNRDKALYSLGILYYRLGNRNKAMRTLQKLIDGYPGSRLIGEARKLLKKTENR